MPAESESSPEPLPATQEAQRFLTAALLVGLLVAAAAAMLLTWLGDEVLEGEALGLDNYARSLVHTVASPGLTRHHAGRKPVWWPLSVLCRPGSWRRWRSWFAVGAGAHCSRSSRWPERACSTGRSSCRSPGSARRPSSTILSRAPPAFPAATPCSRPVSLEGSPRCFPHASSTTP